MTDKRERDKLHIEYTAAINARDSIASQPGGRETAEYAEADAKVKEIYSRLPKAKGEGPRWK